MLAFVVGLAAEARLLRPLQARVFVGGGTTHGAAMAAGQAVAAGATALVSFGLAGGLSPGLPAGTLVIPAAVIHHSRHLATDAALSKALGGVTAAALLAGEAVVASVAEKARLWESTGADAVDLESGAVAACAQQAGLPFAVLRAVCDPAGRALPEAALVALTSSGGIGVLRVAASVAMRPGQIGALLALAGDAARARAALVVAVRQAVLF